MTEFSRTYEHTPGKSFALVGDEKGGLVVDITIEEETGEHLFRISEAVGGWRIAGWFPSEDVAFKVRDELLALTDWTFGPDAIKKIPGLRDKVMAIRDANGEDDF